jgi:Mce-associated membrane protein
MPGTPRKPIRPAGPRGKIRIAGSSPTARKVNPDVDPTDANAPGVAAPDEAPAGETATPEAATPEATAPGTPAPQSEAPETSVPASDADSTDQAAAADQAAPTDEAEPSSPSVPTGDIPETVALDKPSAKSRPKAKGASLTKPGSAKAEAAQPAEPQGVEPQGAPRTATGFLTWRKVAVVSAIAAIIAIFAVVVAFKPGASTESNKAFIDASQTSELKAQAGDRICAVLSIDPTKFDDWANKAKTGLTGQALTEFNEYQSTSRDLASQSGQGAECKVDLVAVATMDDSNATVIATLLISSTQQGVAVLGGPGQARTELGMQKVDGQWRISRISDF